MADYYTFIFKAAPGNRVDFWWSINNGPETQSVPVKVKETDSVNFVLVPLPSETALSVTVTSTLYKSTTPFRLFNGQESTFIWTNGGPGLTVVDQIAQCGFSGVMQCQADDGPTSYTLKDPEVVIGDGP